MAAGEIPLSESADGGKPDSQPQRQPVRVDHYLCRFGSQAILMTVSRFQTGDGGFTTRRSFTVWPGL